VIYELEQAREGLEHKNKEMKVLDNAIEEVEAVYGNVIYSADVFGDR
jgi:hypothetical protein